MEVVLNNVGLAELISLAGVLIRGFSTELAMDSCELRDPEAVIGCWRPIFKMLD